MRLLIDTAVLLFAVESPQRISRRAMSLLQNTENQLELSAVSLPEIAIKSARGKLDVAAPEVQRSIENLDIRILPFTAAHAFALFELPLHHYDPFDRQIIAQTMVEDIPVVTPDRQIRLYKGLRVIW